MSRPDPVRVHVVTPAGVSRVAVVWSPADAAVLARELAAITGRPVSTLPDRFQEDPR